MKQVRLGSGLRLRLGLGLRLRYELWDSAGPLYPFAATSKQHKLKDTELNELGWVWDGESYSYDDTGGAVATSPEVGDGEERG